MSAIVEFSTVEEAKEALKSNTPVLNDRFIEVVSCSSKTEQEGTVEENPSESTSTDPTSGTQSDEVNKKLELIRQRRLAQEKTDRNPPISRSFGSVCIVVGTFEGRSASTS